MFSPTGLPFYPDYELLFLLKPDLELQCLFCTPGIFELLHLILVPLSNYIPTVTLITRRQFSSNFSFHLLVVWWARNCNFIAILQIKNLSVN